MLAMWLRRLTAVLLSAMLAGCSYFAADEAVYRNSRSLDYLKPPQGVDIPPPNYTYRVPDVKAATDAVPEKPISANGGADVSAPVVTVPHDKPVEPAPTSPSPQVKKAARAKLPDVAKPVAPETKAPVPVFVTRQGLTDKMAPRKPAAKAPAAIVQKPSRAVTTRNWFQVDAAPEKVWTRLVSYWMDRGLPLIESNPVSGRIVTDWVPSVDASARGRGIRDQFEVLLERSKAGSKVTLKHRASRKAAVGSDRSEWTLLGSDPVLQGVETARLRDYLTGK